MQGCWLAMSGGKRTWIDIRYEKLSDFCYYCGCLDHNEKDFDNEAELKLGNSNVTSRYCPDVRAETYSNAKPLGTLSLSMSISVGTSSSVREGKASSKYSHVSHMGSETISRNGVSSSPLLKALTSPIYDIYLRFTIGVNGSKKYGR